MEELDQQLDEQLGLVTHLYQVAIDYMVGYSFQLLGAVIVIIVGIFLGRWISNLILRAQERRNVDVTLRQFIASTIRLLVVVMFAVIAVQQLGISITPLIAAIGGLAVGLSLALQGPVSNYGAGLIIILTRMFKVGDTISTQGCHGQVEEISLAATQLRAEDGELIVIPNKHILGEVHSNSDENRIVEGVVGIAYSADPEAAVDAIRAVLDEHGLISQRQPEIGICEFGDSSINIEYRYWAPTGGYFPTVHKVNLGIFKAFKSANIPIPFPQREVRLLSEA